MHNCVHFADEGTEAWREGTYLEIGDEDGDGPGIRTQTSPLHQASPDSGK